MPTILYPCRSKSSFFSGVSIRAWEKVRYIKGIAFRFGMDVFDCIFHAEKEDHYLTWKKQHAGAFLSYVLFDGETEQVGFYAPDTDTVFSVQLDKEMHVCKAWEDIVFRDPEKKVLPLVLDHVTLSFSHVKEKAASFFSTKYKNVPLSKVLYLLENIDGFVVWNITFVTTTPIFVVLKIHPETGELLEERKESLTV